MICREGRARALAAIRFADVKGRGVVLMNHDPGVDLAEVGIGIGTPGIGNDSGALRFRLGHERAGCARGAQSHGEHACVPEELPGRGSEIRVLQFPFDLPGNAFQGAHAVTSVFTDCRASAITFAPRLIAA